MGYFPVRYDSRVVNYDRRGFIRLATEIRISNTVIVKIFIESLFTVDCIEKKKRPIQLGLSDCNVYRLFTEKINANKPCPFYKKTRISSYAIQTVLNISLILK